MAKRERGIRKHGNRLQVRITIKGQRHEETLPVGSSWEDARDYLAQIRRQAINSVVGRPERKTIGDLLDAYEEQARGLKSYQRDLRYRIGVLRERFGEWDSGRGDEAASALAKAKGKLTAAAINRYIAIVRRSYRIAKIALDVELLPGEVRRSAYLRRADVAKLATAAGEWGDLIRFAALTGLRRGELLRLKPEDIKDGMVYVPDDAPYKPRYVPLPPEALRIAQKRIPWGITASNLNRVFRAARERSGLDIRFHDLRRTYATWVAHSGQTLTDIRDLLGHANVSQTNTYLGPADARRLKKATKGLKI